jgi:hypothetical protein
LKDEIATASLMGSLAMTKKKIATPAFGGLAMTKWVDCHGFPDGKPRNDRNGKIVIPAFGGLAMTSLLGSLREPLQKNNIKYARFDNLFLSP